MFDEGARNSVYTLQEKTNERLGSHESRIEILEKILEDTIKKVDFLDKEAQQCRPNPFGE